MPQATEAQSAAFQRFMLEDLAEAMPPEGVAPIAGMFVSQGGDLFVAGQFMGGSRRTSSVSAAYGGADIFVGRMDLNGTWLWLAFAGGLYDDWIVELNETNDDSAFVNGLYFGEADFGDGEVVASQGHVSEYFAVKLLPEGGLGLGPRHGRGQLCPHAVRVRF